MTTPFASHAEYPIYTFASVLTKKGVASNLHGSRQQEIEAPQKDTLATFNALILQYQDAAYNFAYYLLGDPDAASDATQQAFINAYLHFSKFHGSNFRSWLFAILKNTCMDEFRRQKRRNAFSLNALEDDENLAAESLHLSGRMITPEQALDQEETSQMIQSALGRLEEPFRTVLILVDLQEMDYQEAAEVIGIPLGTLKSRLARARQQFQRVLEQ